MTARGSALLAVVAALAVAAPARAAGPYYVSAAGSPHHGLPCDSLNPCAVDWALESNHLPPGSTVLIEAGTYDETTVTPIDVTQPLTIEADPAAATTPLIESGTSFQPVLKFDTGADGSSLSGVDVTAGGLAKPAIDVTVPMSIDHVVVSSATTGIVLGAADSLSHATVSAVGTAAIGIDAAPTASVSNATVSATGSASAIALIAESTASTGGAQVTDTTLHSDGTGIQASGGLAPGAVMRRLAVAATGIGVEMLGGTVTLTDSLAQSSSNDGLQGNAGTLVARNDTVIAPAGDALHALAVPSFLILPATIDARNTIARGAGDVVADPAGTGGTCPCLSGVIDIGYSNFVTATGVTDLGHNQSGDPLFVNPASDFHLRATSPAIDAGVNDPADGTTDLDGHPRVQGTAPDLGAYEATPIVPASPGTPGAPGPGSSGPPVGSAPADTTAPSIGNLAMTHRSFTDRAAKTHRRGNHAARGTAFTFTVSEAARVTIAVSAQTTGRRSHGRCVRATRRLAHAHRCTRSVSLGTVVHAVSKGRVSIAFSGKLGKHALAAGHYRATLTAVDAAGNRSAARSITFTVVRG
jgi:hypothetical protein